MAVTDLIGVTGRWTKAETAAAARPVATARDPRLDFYRGIAMIIILFAHTPGNFFSSWIPARWGFSDATEIFVFCSGMASAIAFGRAFDRSGWLMGAARVAYRCWQVYWAHIGLFFFVAAMMFAIDGTGVYDKNYAGSLNLWKLMSDPGQQIVGLFTLTYVPNYFDVLPMYLVILAMMPVVMALSRIHLALVAVAVVGTWFMAQEAILNHFGLGGLALDLPAEPWSDRSWFFNPFGWQLIFFTGFAFMRGWLAPPPVRPWLVGLALAVVIASAIVSNVGVRELDLGWTEAWRKTNADWYEKTDFGILRYAHFLALAYIAWIVAGAHGHMLLPQSDGPGARIWGRVVTTVMKIGQQSLAVFVFSMAFAQFLGFLLDHTARGTLTVTAINFFGVGMLVLVAYTAGWFKSQPWRQKVKPS